VYGSVGVISDAVASLPVDLMTSPHRRLGTALPPSPLIAQPYAEISATDWWVQFVSSLALRGNFYGHIVERDRDLYPTQIKPIHPDRASVRRLPGGDGGSTASTARVPIDDVVHVPYISMPGSLTGLNPIEYLRNTIGLARAADLYGGAFFQNSARPDVVLKAKGDLDEDDVLALARQWKAAHQGIGHVEHAGGPDRRHGHRDDLDQPAGRPVPGVAPVFAGRDQRHDLPRPAAHDRHRRRTTSWGTGIEQQEMGFTRNTLIGYLSRGERMMTALHPPGQYVKFDLRERLRGDRLQRAQASTLEIASGYLLPDEARADEDRPPLPDGIGQTAIAPINAQSLKQLAEASIAANQPQQPPTRQRRAAVGKPSRPT
jgi:phage portal protein BeeE